MDYETKKDIGFQYVSDLLQPLSSPGKRLLREISPYSPDCRDDLENEYEYIDFFLSAMEHYDEELRKAKNVLMRVKDIGGSIKALSRRELDETEMFEIKSFCLLCDEMDKAFAHRLPSTVTINGEKRSTSYLKLDSLADAIAIFGGGEGFCIEDSARSELTETRREKRRLFAEMKKAKGEQKKRLEIELSEISLKEFGICREILSRLTQSLAPFEKSMLRNLEIMGRMDLLIQKAEAAKKYRLTRPRFENKFEIRNGVNPMIANAVGTKGGEFHPISLDTVRGVTVITGANMGGKTVALKTIALNALLAQCGFFVFAESFIFPTFADIEAAMLDGQDHERGLSSFAADVIRLNDIYKSNFGKERLILCDEFASGTNAEEGSAIFRAFVNAFTALDDYVIMTTHFDGVAEAAAARFQVQGLASLDIKKVGTGARFGPDAVSRYMNYGLIRVGKDAPMPRDAIKVCKLLGIDKKILDEIDVEKETK